MFVRNLCRVFCEIVLKHLQKCVLLMQGEQRQKILLMMTFRVPQEGNLLRQPLMCLFQRLYSFVSHCFIKNKCSTDVFIFSCLLGIWWNACYSSFFFFFFTSCKFFGVSFKFFFSLINLQHFGPSPLPAYEPAFDWENERSMIFGQRISEAPLSQYAPPLFFFFSQP